MKSKIKFSLIEIIVALLMFLMLRPSFTWTWNMLFLQYGLLVLMFFLFDSKQKKDIPLFIFFFIIISIVPIAHGYNIFGIISYILLVVFIPFAKKKDMLGSFTLFKYIIVAVLSLSIIMWFAIIVFQANMPHSVIAPLNEMKDFNYFSYPFLVVPITIREMGIARFHGIFDEPGVVGTMSLLFLYCDGFNLKRYENIVFLVAGFISFSLFFYIGFVIFLLIRVFLDRKLKSFRIVSVLAIVALSVSVLSVPVLNEMIGSRLEYDADRGTIVGNNRSGDDLDDYITSIRWTNKYYWGDEKAADDYSNHASLQNAILIYGAVFIVLFFIFYFLYAKSRLNNNWKEIWMFMLLLFLTLYQRPGFLIPTYLFTFSCIVLSQQERIIEKKR